MAGLDARLLYDRQGAVSTLFLGNIASVNAATAALRAAAGVIQANGGTHMRVEFRNGDGKIVFASNVRGDGAAVEGVKG